MLKFYSMNVRNSCAMLQAFYGSPPSDANDPDNGRYDEYKKNASLYFSLVSPDEADVIIYPTDWNQMNNDIYQRLSKLTSPSKPMIIFHNDDDAKPVAVENALVYRTSMNRANGKPYEYGLPAWSADMVSSLTIRHKKGKPSIGFCGQCTVPIRTQLITKLRQCESLEAASGLAH